MLNKMNISDEDLDSMTEEMMNMFGIDPENPDSDGEDGFELGGAATFPGMMNQFFGGKRKSRKPRGTRDLQRG